MQDTITNLRRKRPNCKGSMLLQTGCGECERCNAQIAARLNEGRVLTEAPVPPATFREACERIADMLQGDDGEAWFEAEKFLKRHAPDLYDEIGMSPLDPLPDFPEPTLLDRAQGFIVGLLIRKPRP